MQHTTLLNATGESYFRTMLCYFIVLKHVCYYNSRYTFAIRRFLINGNKENANMCW